MTDKPWRLEWHSLEEEFKNDVDNLNAYARAYVIGIRYVGSNMNCGINTHKYIYLHKEFSCYSKVFYKLTS